MPTIGIVGITIPGALDCINKINLFSRSSNKFLPYQHPNILFYQLDFAPTHEAQELDRWDIVEDRIMSSINSLIKLGIDFIIIPANTIHKIISNLQAKSKIPILNMLNLVAEECFNLKLTKIGILGTRWTMEMHLYHEPLKSKGLTEIIPSPSDQDILQQTILSELVPTATCKPSSLIKLLEIVKRLKAEGCDGIVLGCTELGLVLNSKNCEVVTIDTTAVLAKGSVERVIMLREQLKTKISSKL